MSDNIQNSGAKTPEFKYLEKYSRALDSSIRIPGTEARFGWDPILGFIPFVGDAVGWGFSMTLIYYLIKHGASKRLVLKLSGNALLDATLGSIPIFGTVFDFFYKANDRNYRLFREYHEQGMHTESSKPYFIAIAAVFLVFLIALTIGAYFLGVWCVSLIQGHSL